MLKFDKHDKRKNSYFTKVWKKKSFIKSKGKKKKGYLLEIL